MSTFNADSTSANGKNGINTVYIKVHGRDLLQIFPLQYQRSDLCALLGSPSEMGVQKYDHKVIKPSSVQFTGVVKYQYFNLFEIIRDSIKQSDLGVILCDFYGKAGSVQKMLIESMDEVGNSTRYDGVEVRIKMQEYLVHSPSKKGKK